MDNLTFTTCLYHDLCGTEFGGRVHPKRKYFYSLLSLLKMNCNFVVYCWERDIDELQQFVTENLGNKILNKISFIDYDLYKSPLYETIKSVKDIEVQKKLDRSYDVAMGKMTMLQKTIADNPYNSKYFFFTDVGLSSSALFPFKFMSMPEDPMRKWSECSLFSNTFISNLKNLSEAYNKVILWKITDWLHWIHPDHLSRNDRSSIIGGIFGGNKDVVFDFTEQIITRFIDIVKHEKFLYLEEVIMTIEEANNPDKYHCINFDTWYHEDSGDWCQSARQNKKSFYHTFEELNK